MHIKRLGVLLKQQQRISLRDMLSTLIVVAALLVLVHQLGRIAVDAITPDVFRPLKAFTLEVVEDSVLSGQQITIHNGICNVTDKTVSLELYVFLQADLISSGRIETSTAQTYDLLGTGMEPRQINLRPGCIGSQPTTFKIPVEVPTGQYRVAFKASAKSEGGKEQNIVQASKTLNIVLP